ncbi:hypothetical protein FXF51_21845 [Nonomuraea sp. PA05]|uniref:hypothetical protein n=1 Tax=Nonomuraea sp. PA05 TaxID=2604466 RepID=UPI0011D84A23|nr:hypothetical protein [Nonomuraea sp. PA05]TYB64362.1 hypothetical protein FXF51_21845 [Nonomuraea sp. PA05]
MADEATQTDESSVAALRLAAQSLMEAIDGHLAALTAGTDSSAERGVVLQALASYDDALASVTVTSQTAPEPARTGGVLSVLTRTDHYVEDFGQLVEAGRDAYRTIQPEAGEDEVRAEVPDVSSALYEILHVNGDEVPFPFPAARPIAGMVWFLSAREAMPVDLHDSPADPFGVAAEAGENLLYAHRSIYAPPVVR